MVTDPTVTDPRVAEESRRRSLLWLFALLMAVAALGSALTSWQRSQLGAQVAALAAPGDLRMLSSRTCGICTQARGWFTQHGVAFNECFIETDRDCAVLFEATRSPGTPVILVRGMPQVGFNPQRLRDALQRPAARPPAAPVQAPALSPRS